MKSLVSKFKWHKEISTLFLVVAFNSASIHACKCMPSKSIIVQKNESDLAFLGRPVSIGFDSNSQKIKTKFAVSEIWQKGRKEQAKWITVESYINPDYCGIEFKTNEKVIIFSNRMTENGVTSFKTTRCMENIPNPSTQQIDSLNLESKSK